MAIHQNKKLKNLIHSFKDKASIIKATFSIHRRSSSIKVAVVRATTHGSRNNPPSDSRLAAVLALGNDFRSSTAFACIEALMERLHTTSSAAVAMKSLFTLHIIVIRGPFNLRDQVAFFPGYGGRNFLNLSAFRDVSDSEMNDLSSWVRWYAGVVEHNVTVDRKLDRILYFRSRNCEIVEDCKEGRKRKIDLSEELEVLVGFVERICEVPESLYLQKKDLVYEVVRLVLEIYRLVQREIWVRVKEMGDRVESLSLDELTDLVGILTRLENCRRKLSVLFVNRGKNEEFWELVKITKGKLAEKKGLDSLTFSMLNQTKILFTAVCTYLLLRQKQSIQQIGALFLLIVAAVLLSIGEGSSKGSIDGSPDQILFHGIIPVLVASVLSGLASALCQWSSQVKKHSSYLMTVEMSIVGSLFLFASTYKSPDGEAIRQHGFFYGWTLLTMIPVLFNALGGILVGLVTSRAGGVRKGFVIVSALLVTALLQFIFEGKPPSVYCIVALPLVVSSISIYQKYPYRVKKKEL